MLCDVYELNAKAIIGETLNDDQIKYLNDYNQKYSEVCRKVIDSRKHRGVEILNFHFTPGDDFMNVPVDEIVENILNSFLNAEPFSFDDKTEFRKVGNEFGNPPKTGRNKASLL